MNTSHERLNPDTLPDAGTMGYTSRDGYGGTVIDPVPS